MYSKSLTISEIAKSAVVEKLENGIYTKDEFINRSKSIKDNIEILENKLKKYTEFLNKNTEIQQE